MTPVSSVSNLKKLLPMGNVLSSKTVVVVVPIILTFNDGIVVASLSAVAYYCTRLGVRDILGRTSWYRKLMAKADRTKLFELYILSILNACVITGYSGVKLVGGDLSDTRGGKRMLASALGYFCHDFIAMRRKFSNDRGMLLHHVVRLGEGDCSTRTSECES